MSSGKKKRGSSSSSTNNVYLVIVCGIPGCGKSTFAKKVYSTQPGWLVVSQDDLGSRQAVEKAMETALRKEVSVLLDRCNVNKKERAQWVRLARNNATNVIVEAVYLDVPVEECKQRVKKRQGHATLSDDQDTDSVIDRFARTVQPPQQREGFANIYSIRDQSEMTKVLQTFKSKKLSPKGIKQCRR
mmetsp:Transcript_20655/g.30692  ORF Transcript_20655/g.30692 Transcript_20655/m.30692 type:complete len:187 (+) Transcript_20655:36-596(+)